VTRLLIRDLAQVATHRGHAGPRRGAALGEVAVVEHAYVLVGADGRLESVGAMRDLGPVAGDLDEIDGTGLSAVPGLVDCHTHPAFAGDRVHEFALRARGATYEELLTAGGGILSTTRATRAAGADALREIVTRHRDAMAAHGTTTFEGKSGYGLDRDTELAQLEAVAAADGVPTWLGAHAVPPEHPDADAYVEWAIAEVLPAASRIAVAADIFVERGAFDVETARRYLRACRDAGLALRLHGDQLSEIGAVPLAVELQARSVDHLEETGLEGVAALAASDVTAVLLPVAALYLARPMPPARTLVDAGAVVALASDFNPGSAFCESLPVVATLACTQLRLSPEEALGAMTVNAAHVLGLVDRGRLESGLRADLVLIDAPDWRHLAYHFAGDVVHTVVRNGQVVVSRA
jgi:imidazolonepropionase